MAEVAVALKYVKKRGPVVAAIIKDYKSQSATISRRSLGMKSSDEKICIQNHRYAEKH